MTSSALLIPSRSVDAQGIEGLLSPRGCLAADLAEQCFGKSPRADCHLKPQLVSLCSWLCPHCTSSLCNPCMSCVSTEGPALGRQGAGGKLPLMGSLHAAHRRSDHPIMPVAMQSGGWGRKSLSGDATGLGEPEPGSDAAALTKMRGHWLLPAVGKPAAAAVLADLKVQRIADGEQQCRLGMSLRADCS